MVSYFLLLHFVASLTGLTVVVTFYMKGHTFFEWGEGGKADCKSLKMFYDNDPVPLYEFYFYTVGGRFVTAILFAPFSFYKKAL